MRYYCTIYSSTGALLQIRHTTMLVVNERRVGRVDGGPGDGKSTQLQFALSSADLLSACYQALLRSIAFSNNRLPLTSDHLEPPSMVLPPFVPPVAPSCSRRRDFFWHSIFETGPASKEPASLLCKNAAARHPAAPERITSPQSNARHDPKTGRARRRP